MMINSTIKDESYLGPFEHKNKLEVGDVQLMTWEGDQDGPLKRNT